MPTEPLLSDDLFDPITAEQPAGADLRWTPEWDRIKEARRADDGLESGSWTKKDAKVADWPLVKELATTMLRNRTKDLQIAMWLTEANLKLHGFAGLRDSFRLIRELVHRYWDTGLYPVMEDGPEDRAAPFEWLNDKLVDSIAAVPITARSDQGRDYSFIDLKEARRIGSEASYKQADGEVDGTKKKAFDAALAEGKISLDMFNRAVKATTRTVYEDLYGDFHQAHVLFKELDKIIDQKFGEFAPNVSACRSTLNEIDEAISGFLGAKRGEEPVLVNAAAASAGSFAERATAPVTTQVSIAPRLPLWSAEAQPAAAAGSWQEAEMLIRSGQVDQGLEQMRRLAANETSGRSRFQRKLLLAEACLPNRRERLARLILEELAEQIDKFQLDQWENSELISAVWTNLYKLYRQGDSSDSERADKLYERLCRLDPWQALGCGEN